MTIGVEYTDWWDLLRALFSTLLPFYLPDAEQELELELELIQDTHSLSLSLPTRNEYIRLTYSVTQILFSLLLHVLVWFTCLFGLFCGNHRVVFFVVVVVGYSGKFSKKALYGGFCGSEKWSPRGGRTRRQDGRREMNVEETELYWVGDIHIYKRVYKELRKACTEKSSLKLGERAAFPAHWEGAALGSVMNGIVFCVTRVFSACCVFDPGAGGSVTAFYLMWGHGTGNLKFVNR